MRFSTEHQRNIAFDLLRLKRKGISITKYFQKGEPVVIYGLDFLGKEMYFELKEWVNIICFIDRSHDMEFFDGIPIFSIDNTALKTFFMKYEEVNVLVMVLSDWPNISSGILKRFENAVPISPYLITASLKVVKTDYFAHKQQSTIEIVKKMVNNEVVNISNIVLVGTSYTALLSTLVLPDWKNSLFLAERFFPSKVVEQMTANNILCLYEEEAGEFYDICYMIAAYARQKDIPIYGHDHMLLSRSFFENTITVIEDGDANYDFKHAVTYHNILDNGNTYYPFGFDKNVSKVFLTGLMDVPKELETKAERIVPSALWKLKSEAEKRMISNIFSFPYCEILNLVQNGKNIIFLTEAYAYVNGDNVISVEKQIELYKEILSNYDSDRIFIKPHPSDNADYATLMPEYKVISKQFPMQMLKWTGIEFKKIILLWGTTCMHVFANDFNVDVHKDILYRYGILH
ncbi:hypothetical protein [Parablautia muri]|uniref:Uncharacterized protein n=1 Tax=Parablautia muri TaxID=2320879 RepID=A0A9X5GS16_9FIRM|nr:hypothetical protein [Parablautia muri]NBJ92530.1 hypothetical protein [Parablautia muri]